MRPFEVLILLFSALSLLPLFLAARYRTHRLRWLPLSAILALLLHLLVEGYRWQMIPAYALAISLALLALLPSAHYPQTRFLQMFLGLVGFLWLALAIALPVILPVPQPLAPSGPFAVGTRSYYLEDQSRPEIFNDQVPYRELMLQVWYPAIPTTSDTLAPFIDRIDVAGPAIARRLNLPPFISNHFNLVQTHAYLGAQASDDGPFPLLIFSHGLRGLRAQNTSLMQELASHGYVVAALDHPYANVLTVFPGDRIVFYNQEAVMPAGMTVTEAGARLVEVWALDIAFAAQQLQQWNETPDHPLQGRVDATRLGLLGHSTGGGAAIQACAALAECDGVVALDGWIEPVDPRVRDRPYSHPIMFLSAPDWLGANNRALGQQLYEQRQAGGYLLTVAGTVHFDFTDIPLMSPATRLIGLSGDIAGSRVVTLLNDYTLAFFNETLKGQSSPLLQGPGEPYPEVTFAP